MHGLLLWYAYPIPPLHTYGDSKSLSCVFYSDLCIRHKKIFAHEHTLYNPKQLLLHVPAMKRVPQMPAQHQHKPKDPGKGKGKEIEAEAVKEDTVDSVHPLCAFCRDCFYGDDELYAHLRERHEECFVCKRMGTSHV